MRYLLWMGLLLSLSLSSVIHAKDTKALLTQVRTPGVSSAKDPRSLFDLAILQRALELTQSEGPFSLETIDTRLHPLNQAQLFEQTSGWNRIDVVASMATDERAAYAQTVPIDLTQGMIGQRVLIIRANEQSRFSQITQIHQLKALTICIGRDWPDAKIMQQAGFKLKLIEQYETLFSTLAAKGCDAISRGLHEAPEEIRSWPKLNLAIEQNLLLQYPARNLFFVHPLRPRLAERLQRGLQLALKNGDFQRSFQLYFSEALSLQQQPRRVFHISNPLDHPDQKPTRTKMAVWVPQTSQSTETNAIASLKIQSRPDSLRYLGGEDMKDRRLLYGSELLSAIVRNSEAEFGPIELIEVRPSSSLLQQRALTSLGADGLLDVVLSMESTERNQQFLKIDQLLDHGLLGLRVLLVRAEDLAQFRQIRELSQLQKKSVGLGHDWPDVDIMRHNGFQVVTGPSYEGLFNMLPLKRFDFLSRSALEFVSELKRFPTNDINWVPGLLLSYPAPLRFYVSKDKPLLAKRLEHGLKRTKDIGEFDRLFDKYYGETLRLLKQQTPSQVLHLDNPLLPSNSPAPELELLRPKP